MNGMSMKEKAVLAVLAVVFLYAAAGVLWFVRQADAWSKARKAYEKSRRTYETERKLISQKAKWHEDYEREKSLMPMFAADKATDTVWLQKVSDIAARNFIQIQDRKVGRETAAGDVLEMQITGSNWEGSLKSLVRFMYELETTSEGMFDISSISCKPCSAPKKGFLRGGFTLTCAYMRE